MTGWRGSMTSSKVPPSPTTRTLGSRRLIASRRSELRCRSWPTSGSKRIDACGSPRAKSSCTPS